MERSSDFTSLSLFVQLLRMLNGFGIRLDHAFEIRIDLVPQSVPDIDRRLLEFHLLDSVQAEPSVGHTGNLPSGVEML